MKWVVAKRPPDGLELLYTVEAVPFLSMVVAMLAIEDSRRRRPFFSNFPFFFPWVQTKVRPRVPATRRKVDKDYLSPYSYSLFKKLYLDSSESNLGTNCSSIVRRSYEKRRIDKIRLPFTNLLVGRRSTFSKSSSPVHA